MKNLKNGNEVQLSELQFELEKASSNSIFDFSSNEKGFSFEKDFFKKFLDIFYSFSSYQRGVNNDFIWYKRVNLFLDSFSLGYFLQRFIKSKTEKSDFFNLILLDDHIITMKDVLESNFSIFDLGLLISDVYSSRYNMPITSFKKELCISENFFSIISSISSIRINPSYDGVRSSVSTQNYNSINNSEGFSLNVICNYENSLISDVWFFDEIKRNVSIIEFSKDSTKIFLNSFRKEIINDESFTKSEFFESFFLNVTSFFPLFRHRINNFFMNDIINEFSFYQKKDGKISIINIVPDFIFTYISIMEKVIKINKNVIELDIFEERSSKNNSFTYEDDLNKILLPLSFSIN